MAAAQCGADGASHDSTPSAQLAEALRATSQSARKSALKRRTGPDVGGGEPQRQRPRMGFVAASPSSRVPRQQAKGKLNSSQQESAESTPARKRSRERATPSRGPRSDSAPKSVVAQEEPPLRPQQLQRVAQLLQRMSRERRQRVIKELLSKAQRQQLERFLQDRAAAAAPPVQAGETPATRGKQPSPAPSPQPSPQPSPGASPATSTSSRLSPLLAAAVFDPLPPLAVDAQEESLPPSSASSTASSSELRNNFAACEETVSTSARQRPKKQRKPQALEQNRKDAQDTVETERRQGKGGGAADAGQRQEDTLERLLQQWQAQAARESQRRALNDKRRRQADSRRQQREAELHRRLEKTCTRNWMRRQDVTLEEIMQGGPRPGGPPLPPALTAPKPASVPPAPVAAAPLALVGTSGHDRPARLKV